MVDKIFYPQPIVPVGPSKEIGKPQRSGQINQTPFKEVLESQIAAGGIKFSAHAEARLASRNIQLTQAELTKLSVAVEQAAQKGSRDSLIMMDKMAFVVSVQNKTVVTAVDDASMKEHVFTNIDSAVII
ncbi:MAG: TIGR02530 family flagellar biosynthesis protein [Eubacteriales bacterium]